MAGVSWDGGASSIARPDTTTFEDQLSAHMTLPPDERDQRRLQAEQRAAGWRAFEQEAWHSYDRVYRPWWYAGMPRPGYAYVGIGLGNSLRDLHRAVDTDPGFAEAWGALGHLCLEAGDLASGEKYLRRARLAAATQREAGRPLPREQELRIHRDLAWSLRDLARWEEGLAAVDEGCRLAPRDQELMLIRGLLLAGQGRFSEAMSVAVRMEPMRFPLHTFTFKGFLYKKSSYANNWIRSMAYLAEGDVSMAHRLLGSIDTYSYWGRIPLGERYWRDVGLVAELAHDPRAPVWYSMGHISRYYLGYFPLLAQNVASQALDLPNPIMPCFTSFHSRFYAGGSPLTYVAGQMNLMAMVAFDNARTQAAGRALQMLEILERRHVQPAYCNALRGRIYFANDDFSLAATALDSARTLYAADGATEPVTSMILGLLALQDEDWPRAETLLAEALEADPDLSAAWRSLGVACARQGKADRAGDAFEQAVVRDPGGLANYYNRGLFHLQQRAFGPAVADLTHAYRLDPENREVQRVLQTAVSGARGAGQVVTVHQGPPAGYHPAPDSLLAAFDAQVQELFSLPDSLRTDDAAATARIVELEREYALNGELELRRILALAYLDHGRYREVQLLLGPDWQRDLLPEEELMLLYADRHLGEQERARILADQLIAGGPGAGNPYLWSLTSQIIRNDPRVGLSKVDRIFLKYCQRTKAKTYGFPDQSITRYMFEGFSSAREYRTARGIMQAPVIRDEFGLTTK